jgi:hypothetical protein
MAFFVSVPSFAGVPAIASSSIGSAAISLLKADAYSLLSGIFGTPKWGIYFFGIPIVIADTVTSFDMNQQWKISDFPTEQGSFQSYNKVYVPFRGTFRFVAGGSTSNRQLLLTSIEAIAGDLNQYDIVTPEAVYSGVSVTSFEYKRTAQSGVGLISVDVVAEEVRSAPAASTATTAAPQSAAQTNGGTVQATPATPAQAAQAPSVAHSEDF